MIYLIYFILILFFVLDYLKNKDLLTPIKLFNFIWFVTLFAYEFKLSYIQQDFSHRTLLIFLTAIISFDLCSTFALNFKKGILRHDKINDKIQKNILKKPLSSETKFKIATSIFIIIFIISVIYSKGVPLLWKIQKIPKTYLDFGITSIQGALNGLACILGAYSLFAKKNKYKYIFIIYGILIISRQVLMTIFVEGVVFKLLSLNKDDLNRFKRKIPLLIVIIILGFSIIGNFRSGANITTDMFTPRPGYEFLPKSIKWIYSYGTFSLSNFNKLVSMSNGNVNYGSSTLETMLPTIFLNIFSIKKNVNLYPYYLVNRGYTVSTYLVEMYMDFGFAGIILFHIIIGFLGCKLYKLARINSSEKNEMFYSIYVHNIVFLFFVNMFIYPPIYIQFIYAMLIFDGGGKFNEHKK